MADWPEDVKTIAVITWDDSHGIGGWHGGSTWEHEFREFDSTCVSVGYIAHEDERRVWLVQSLSACGSMADAILIPKHAILERHEFEPTTPIREREGG